MEDGKEFAPPGLHSTQCFQSNAGYDTGLYKNPYPVTPVRILKADVR